MDTSKDDSGSENTREKSKNDTKEKHRSNTHSMPCSEVVTSRTGFSNIHLIKKNMRMCMSILVMVNGIA